MIDRAHRLFQRIGTAMALLAGGAACAACSVLAAQKKTDQCNSDSDCSAHADARCDLFQHVCLTGVGEGTPDAGGSDGPGFPSDADSCWNGSWRGDAGCSQCPVKSESDLLNACTGNGCEPFGNASRIAGFEAGKPLRMPIPVPRVVVIST
jgi:hypothetical protein